ncbi:MAG: hypothetical protein JAZ11_02860 [Candidatus Thiodiazotropha lotti]|nr:hypothetical protein [Candidatus Thiodiazotropha lotti]
MNCSPQFLIVTNKRDLTSDFVVKEMRERGLEFYRLNTEDSPLLAFTQELGSSTVLSSGKSRIDLKRVRAAYFRRPLPPTLQLDDIPPSSKHYIYEEWSYLLRSLYLELGEKWFSHPNRIILAEDKPKQLRLAREIGFAVPDTVITNELEAVRGLFATGEVVAKPLKQALLEDQTGPGSVIYTSTIHSFSEIDENALGVVPVIFQRKLPKQFDLRVTVVEKNVFSVAIKSQEFEETKTDWRHSAVTNLEHEIFDLPGDVADRCREIVKRLGLRYGAIDLVLDLSGKFWFLECNPNGQWAWIENRTGLPIADAIVNSMENMSQ